MKKLRLCFLLFLCTNSFAAQEVVARLFFTEFMGHVHKNPSKTSSSMTTLQCGHVIKVLSDKNISVPLGWSYVQVGEDKGYMQTEFLGNKRPTCFQAKYPKFFNSMNLDLTDMYYWGRLLDQYSIGKTKLR